MLIEKVKSFSAKSSIEFRPHTHIQQQERDPN